VSWQSVTIQIVTSGAVGAVAGGVTGNFKPVVEGWVRKRSSRRTARQAKVQAWREGIDRLSRAEAAASGQPGMTPPGILAALQGEQLEDTQVLRESWFASLREAMRPGARKEADELAALQPHRRPAGELSKLLNNEVNRLERHWKLT
jgi:hypothetical protein